MQCTLHGESVKAQILSYCWHVFINFYEYVTCKLHFKMVLSFLYVLGSTRVENTCGEVKFMGYLLCTLFSTTSLPLSLFFTLSFFTRFVFPNKHASSFSFLYTCNEETRRPFHQLLGNFLASFAIVALLEETTLDEKGASVGLRFDEGFIVSLLCQAPTS